MAHFALTKQQLADVKKIKNFDTEQLKTLQDSLKKKGVTVVDGTYLSGKSTLAAGILKSMVEVALYIKLTKSDDSKAKKQQIKTYTIKELLE